MDRDLQLQIRCLILDLIKPRPKTLLTLLFLQERSPVFTQIGLKLQPSSLVLKGKALWKWFVNESETKLAYHSYMISGSSKLDSTDSIHSTLTKITNLENALKQVRRLKEKETSHLQAQLDLATYQLALRIDPDLLESNHLVPYLPYQKTLNMKSRNFSLNKLFIDNLLFLTF